MSSRGRPPMYDDGEVLRKKCDEYFIYIKGETKDKGKTWEREPEPPTVTGLALYLGFAAKSSLYDYAKKEIQFSYPIKRALTMVEHHHELGLHSKSPTGHIFALKNSGWSDKVEQEITGKKPFKIINIGYGIPPDKDDQDFNNQNPKKLNG